MARSAQVGVHGRARQHIVAIGGLFAERFNSPDSDLLVLQDRFLALLLRNATITEEQLRRAIDSYRRHPQDYAWILGFRHTTLDTADHVFFARHGRFPTEDNDFLANGDYFQICRTLQYDPDGFEEELRKLAWDAEGNVRPVETPPKVLVAVQRVASEKGNKPVFTLILSLGLASALALPLLVANAPRPFRLLLGLAAGVGCVLLLTYGLIATRPRQFQANVTQHSCSECHSSLECIPSAKYCPHCGVRFEEQAEGKRHPQVGPRSGQG
jgi:hypothetical protein